MSPYTLRAVFRVPVLASPRCVVNRFALYASMAGFWSLATTSASRFQRCARAIDSAISGWVLALQSSISSFGGDPSTVRPVASSLTSIS